MNTCFKYCLNIIMILVLMNNTFPQDSIENIEEDESTSLTYGVENDFVSRYIWHGLSCNHGLIQQPSVWVTFKDFTFFSWASVTQYEADNSTTNNEIDFAIQYSNQLDVLNLESSVTYIYCMQEDVPATTELFLKIGCEIFESELYTDITTDVMEYSGSFSGSIGINKSLFENEDISFATGFCFGWANKLFNENYLGITENIKPFNYSSLSAELTYYVFENFYLKPHIEYCYLFSPAFKQISGNSLENFGIAAGVEF